MELRDELRDLIAEVGEIDDRERITDTADLYAELGLDSMNALEIILEVERRLGVRVPEEALREIRCLGDVVRVVGRLQAGVA